MGCDIHAVIEYRAEPGAGWHRYEGELPDAVDGRSYYVFALLADVRNYDGVTPIAEPRGLPDDFAPAGRGFGPDTPDDPDIHSLSWLSLRDLESYDWDSPITGSLLIPEARYLRWRDGDRKHPGSGFRGCSAPVYSEDEYRAAERAGDIPSGGAGGRERPAVRISWTERVGDVVPSIPGELIPTLRKLGAPDDVRVVFGFDN